MDQNPHSRDSDPEQTAPLFPGHGVPVLPAKAAPQTEVEPVRRAQDDKSVFDGNAFWIWLLLPNAAAGCAGVMSLGWGDGADAIIKFFVPACILGSAIYCGWAVSGEIWDKSGWARRIFAPLVVAVFCIAGTIIAAGSGCGLLCAAGGAM